MQSLQFYNSWHFYNTPNIKLKINVKINVKIKERVYKLICHMSSNGKNQVMNSQKLTYSKRLKDWRSKPAI